MRKTWFKIGILVGLIIIAAIIMFFYSLISVMRFNHTYIPLSMRMEEMFESFIASHEGRFPESKQELIEEGFLRNHERLGYEIKIIYESDVEWALNPYYDDFTIAYGIELEQLEECDGKLIDKNTKQPVYIIIGPTSRSWSENSYMDLSIKIFNAMKKYCDNKKP